MNDNIQVAILGCGLSGMITALGLASRGIKSTIIEASKAGSSNDNRTTALTRSSQDTLAQFRIWDGIEQLAGFMHDIYVLDNRSREMVHLQNSDGNSILGYIVPNSDFKSLLVERVKSSSLITLLEDSPYRDVKCSTNVAEIYLNDGKVLTTDLVIVCDGQNSYARRKYFTNKIDRSYRQVAFTFNVCHEKPHEGTAVEHFMSGGPFAILPLKSQRNSSVVWTLGEKAALVFKNLPLEEFEHHVAQNFGDFLGQIKIDSPIDNFPLKARVASKYFCRRIVLVADTAHIVHPLAGQGLNQGIKDIKTLVELIEHKQVGEGLLQEYQALRADDNMAMYQATDLLNCIFTNEFLTLKVLRRIGLAAFDTLGTAKNMLLHYASGVRD